LKDSVYIQSEISSFYYKIQNSKFYSFIYPVNSVEEVKNNLSLLKNKYADSSHICYAYRLFSGYDLLNSYNTDDFSADAGEPRGSSGPPILKVLKRHKMINVVIFVVRYFGGRKLGISGLIEAYANAAEGLIDIKNKKKWFPTKRLELKYSYSLESSLNQLFKIFNIKIYKHEYNDYIISIFDINEKEVESFKQRLCDYPFKSIKII
jgi:uncharacterized YigZ family protein